MNFPSILAEFLTNVSLGEGRGGGGGGEEEKMP